MLSSNPVEGEKKCVSSKILFKHCNFCWVLNDDPSSCKFSDIYILVLQCINGVSSNPVEGRTKICQLKDQILTLFGLIFRRVYIYNICTLSVNIKFICTSFRNR